MNKTQQFYCQALGIEQWERRSKQPPTMPVEANAMPTPNEGWEALKAAVKTCTACGLHQTRTQTVFGVGNPNADLMIIGEAPGFHEDQQGEPFVGRAGQLLTAMIKTMGFERHDVYIANILKCRPPNNRDTQPVEVQTCTPFLVKQIAFVNPRLLLAVGRIAAHYLLNTKASLTSLRNKIYPYGVAETPLIVTYHPAYLLRNPSDKKKAFLDLQFAQQTLQHLSGVTQHGSIPPITEQTLL